MLCGISAACIELDMHTPGQVKIRVTGPLGDKDKVLIATEEEWETFVDSILFSELFARRKGMKEKVLKSIARQRSDV